MNERLHAFLPQELTKTIAVRRADHVVLEAIHMALIVEMRKTNLRYSLEPASIQPGHPSSMIDP